MVLVLNLAVIALPVTHKIHLSFITRWHPPSSCVRWMCPVAFVPSVTFTFNVPITVYPHVLGSRASHDTNDARPRWRTNPDSNGDLSAECRSASQQYKADQCCCDEVLHTF